MRNLLLFAPLFVLLSCQPQQKPHATKVIEDKVFLFDGKVKCEIYLETDMYSRIKTDTIVDKNYFQIITDTLKAKNDIVYFHLSELLDRGQEYGSLTSGFALAFDDFDKDKLLKEKAEEDKKALDKIKREGVRDDDFAGKAFIMSKDFVKQELLSPKSADFPFQDYQSSNVIDNTIVIQSYVDAKNAFGTEVRHNYTIKMKKIGTDWSAASSWIVISLDFN